MATPHNQTILLPEQGAIVPDKTVLNVTRDAIILARRAMIPDHAALDSEKLLNYV